MRTDCRIQLKKEKSRTAAQGSRRPTDIAPRKIFSCSDFHAAFRAAKRRWEKRIFAEQKRTIFAL
jgi:hypothetical protein